MKVKELIDKLTLMPPEAKVKGIYDGSSYMSIDLVWETRNGQVRLCPYGDVVYHTSDRPKDAPKALEERHWNAPKDPTEPPYDTPEHAEWQYERWDKQDDEDRAESRELFRKDITENLSRYHMITKSYPSDTIAQACDDGDPKVQFLEDGSVRVEATLKGYGWYKPDSAEKDEAQ